MSIERLLQILFWQSVTCLVSHICMCERSDCCFCVICNIIRVIFFHHRELCISDDDDDDDAVKGEEIVTILVICQIF